MNKQQSYGGHVLTRQPFTLVIVMRAQLKRGVCLALAKVDLTYTLHSIRHLVSYGI